MQTASRIINRCYQVMRSATIRTMRSRTPRLRFQPHAVIALIGMHALFGKAAPPDPLDNKRIVLDQSFISKSVYFEQSPSSFPQMNYIEHAQPFDDKVDAAISRIAVFDQSALWSIDTRTLTASFLGPYRGDSYMRRPALLNLDADENPEIILRGGGFGGVGIVDSDGRHMWSKSGSFAQPFTANSMAGGDLDQDGTFEFYVAARSGLYRLDCQGAEVWRHTHSNDIYWHVEVYDQVSGIDPEVVSYLQSSEGKGYLEVRDPNGLLLRRIGPLNIRRFRILKWSTPEWRYHILTYVGKTILVLDPAGHIVFDHKISWLRDGGFGVEGTLVKLSDDCPALVAVLTGTRAGLRRSIFSLFSLNGSLVYQEILGYSRGLLAIRLTSDAKGESLLVGDGIGKILIYDASTKKDCE